MGQCRAHHRQVLLHEAQSQRTHGLNATADLGLDESAILQRCRDALPVDHVQRLAAALLQRLQPVVQRLIVGGDQAALVDAEILGQAGDYRVGLRQQCLGDLPQRGVLPFGVVVKNHQRVFQHTRGVEDQRNTVLLQQRLDLLEMRKRHGTAAAGIVGQLDADIADLRSMSFDLRLKRGQINVAFEGLVGLQVEHRCDRYFQRRETLVDLMEDRAWKQDVLRHPPLLLPCLAEEIFGGAPRLGKREVREREDAAQTCVHVDRPLDLRKQTGHLPVDGGQLQLRPGIGLQIEIDLSGVEVLWIEAGRFQRLPTGTGCDFTSPGRRCGRWRCHYSRSGCEHSGCCVRGRLVDICGRRVGDHQDDVEDVVRLARVDRAAQKDVLALGAELVLELQVARIVEDVLLAKILKNAFDRGIRVVRIAEFAAISTAQAEGFAAIVPQRLDDVDDGEFQTT